MEYVKLEKVYSAKTDKQREEAYDAWAEQYEADLFSFGFRLPTLFGSVCARFVEPDTGRCLDAGCGTGLQSESLSWLGYGPITGIDISKGMLAVAETKGIYAELRQMILGEPLGFEDDWFSLTYAIGCITPGHAPPHAFDELIRVTEKGGRLLFTLRVDEGQAPEYSARVAYHECEGNWRKLFQSPAIVSMPFGEPEVQHSLFVYERLRNGRAGESNL